MATMLERVDAAINQILSGQVQSTTISLPGGKTMTVTALDIDKLRSLRKELLAETALDSGEDESVAVFQFPGAGS